MYYDGTSSAEEEVRIYYGPALLKVKRQQDVRLCQNVIYI